MEIYLRSNRIDHRANIAKFNEVETSTKDEENFLLKTHLEQSKIYLLLKKNSSSILSRIKNERKQNLYHRRYTDENVQAVH